MKISPTLLSGKETALVFALSCMLSVKPCRKKLPCFRKQANGRAATMFSEFWQTLSTEEREEFQYRLLRCRYWRNLGCFTSWEHFQEMWGMPYGLEDDFEQAFESRILDERKTMRLVMRTLLERRIPLSVSEVRYCLDVIGENGREKASELMYRLLLHGCYKVEILSTNSFNGVLVRYLREQNEWAPFPAS